VFFAPRVPLYPVDSRIEQAGRRRRPGTDPAGAGPRSARCDRL